MNNLEKGIKPKKICSIILLIVAATCCGVVGFYAIAFLQSSLTDEDSLYKIAMVLVMFIAIPLAVFSLICNTISIILQFKLKEHKNLIQLILSFLLLVINIAFGVLYIVILYI